MSRFALMNYDRFPQVYSDLSHISGKPINAFKLIVEQLASDADPDLFEKACQAAPSHRQKHDNADKMLERTYFGTNRSMTEMDNMSGGQFWNEAKAVIADPLNERRDIAGNRPYPTIWKRIQKYYRDEADNLWGRRSGVAFALPFVLIGGITLCGLRPR